MMSEVADTAIRTCTTRLAAKTWTNRGRRIVAEYLADEPVAPGFRAIPRPEH